MPSVYTSTSADGAITVCDRSYVRRRARLPPGMLTTMSDAATTQPTDDQAGDQKPTVSAPSDVVASIRSFVGREGGRKR